MKRGWIITLPLVVICVVGPIVAALMYDAHRSEGLTAEVIARAPERGNFSPRKITVSVGEPVLLQIRNIDTVMHGFAIPDLGVDAGEIPAGTVARVAFTPEKVGAYDYYCTVWCSEFHIQMRGVLEVVAREP